MAVKDIPAKTVHICDACKAEHEATSSGLPPHWGLLTVKRDAYDWQGAAVADASVQRHLCEPCTEAVVAAINDAIKLRMTVEKLG